MARTKEELRLMLDSIRKAYREISKEDLGRDILADVVKQHYLKLAKRAVETRVMHLELEDTKNLYNIIEHEEHEEHEEEAVGFGYPIYYRSTDTVCPVPLPPPMLPRGSKPELDRKDDDEPKAKVQKPAVRKRGK